MNVFKIKVTTTHKFFRRQKWIRNLRLLDALRPRLLRSEYVVQLVEKGYELKKVKVVYNVINEYMSLDEFSMYPKDNLNYYLREKSDLSFLLERIYSKLKIIRKEKTSKSLNSNLTGGLTVIVILNTISEE